MLLNIFIMYIVGVLLTVILWFAFLYKTDAAQEGSGIIGGIFSLGSWIALFILIFLIFKKGFSE